MNFKKQFHKSFSYTWYFYLLAIVLPIVVFPLSYSFMHRAKEYETLNLFLSTDTYSDKLEKKIKKDLSYLNLKKTEILSSDPYDNEFNYFQKLTVVAYNRSDILIIPEDKLETALIYTTALELNDNVKNLCGITNENLYIAQENYYGVEINSNSPIYEDISWKNEVKYYAFLNANSWNIGEYSKQNKSTTNAFDSMKYIIGKN